MGQGKPKFKLENRILPIILDSAATLVFVMLLLHFLLNWGELPERIPIHYASSGEADGWGSPWVLWILFVLGLIFWISMSILERYSHVHNYPFEIKEENRLRVFANSVLTLNVLKNESCLFFYI